MTNNKLFCSKPRRSRNWEKETTIFGLETFTAISVSHITNYRQDYWQYHMNNCSEYVTKKCPFVSAVSVKSMNFVIKLKKFIRKTACGEHCVISVISMRKCSLQRHLAANGSQSHHSAKRATALAEESTIIIQQRGCFLIKFYSLSVSVSAYEFIQRHQFCSCVWFLTRFINQPINLYYMAHNMCATPSLHFMRTKYVISGVLLFENRTKNSITQTDCKIIISAFGNMDRRHSQLVLYVCK